MIGLGRFKDSRGYYIGELKGGNPHGKGIMTLDDGTIKKGMWIAGNFIVAVDFPDQCLME
jgi:hypothetical protein